MARARTAIGRLLIALALIVQIWAPVGSSVAMVTAATDPLAGALVCAEHVGGLTDDRGGDPADAHFGEACALCQLVAGGGFAPPVEPPQLAVPAQYARPAAWTGRIQPVAVARLLDHIRGRAPPALS